MYGTVGRLQIKPGALKDVKRVIQELEDVPGVIAMSLVGKDGSANDYCWTIMWNDKDAHDANLNRPEYSDSYQRLRDSLSMEPEWHSGEIVYSIPR